MPRGDRGAALAVAVLASATAALLGIGILMLSETEALRAKAWKERAQSRAAAAGAVQVAAAWLVTPGEAVGLPTPQEWILDRRRGDSDCDGQPDAGCDGSIEEGRWNGYPLAPPEEDPELGRLVTRFCGEPGTPDLVLEGGPTLAAMSRALGDDVLIERIALGAGPAIRGARSSVSIEATASIRRGRHLVARVTATGRVTRLPRLVGDDAIVAGGDVRLARAAAVAWGGVRATGDIHLAELTAEFPRSGIPRRGDGNPVGWATGGVTDWNRGTSEREYVLSELIGRSRMTVQIPTNRVRPAVLADPWLLMVAGGSIVVDGDRQGTEESIQPFPYDPVTTALEDDLSFMLANADDADPLDEGRAVALRDAVRGGLASGPLARRFVRASGALGEPTWQESGRGPARTAAEWLASTPDRPAIAVFANGQHPAPETITIRRVAGIVVMEAGTLVLMPEGDPVSAELNLPGEPFVDLGIDADGDGVIDPETIGNGRWDADFDGDGLADETASDGWELGLDMGPGCFLPYHDQPTATLPVHPHEPHLNLAYPADMEEGPLRVRFRQEIDWPAAPVRDVDGDGVIREGIDRYTTLARDAEGGRVVVPAHAHALVVNLGGGILLAEGYQLLGAVRAKGDVALGPGARIRFDGSIARDGRPNLPLPDAGLSGLAFEVNRPRAGAGSRALPAPEPDAEPEAEPGGEPPGPSPGPGRGGGPGGSGPQPRQPGDGSPRRPDGERTGI